MSSAKTSYEVYILQGADKWTLHVRYGAADRKRAIESAKELDVSKGVKAVRVIRETYNPDTNEADEVVVYETKNRDKIGESNQKRQPLKAQKSSGIEAAAKTKAVKTKAVKTKTARSKKKKAATVKKANTQNPQPSEVNPTILGLFIKFVMVILISLFVGTVVTLGVDYLLAVTQSKGVQLNKIIHDVVPISAFLFGFLAVFLPLLTRLFQQAGGGKSRRTNVEQAHIVHHGGAARHKQVIRKKGPSKADLKRIREETLQKLEEEKEAAAKQAQQTRQADDTKTDTAPSAENVKTNDRTDSTESRESTESTYGTESTETTESTENTYGTESTDSAESTESAEDDINQPEDTPKLKMAKSQMLSFLGSALEAAKQSGNKLDQRNKFGVSLFMAGACNISARRRSLSFDEVAAVLHQCICALGTAPNVSKTFVKKIPNYLVEPQYKEMYDRGAQAMKRFIDRGEAGDTGINSALEDWNRPVQAAGGGKLMAVMFTDIINSTALTQKLGDHGAQEMVHIHNRLVRSEIVAQMGKEVKHMGDGIMCSFNTPTAAVEAGVAMQKALQKHNESGHHIQFEIRIGINAGELIREENDLFGSTVQMAARVCAKADSYQVYVSDVVKSNASAKSAHFVSAGSFELKGFSEPVELFEAVWR